ncbi:MAG: VOC family protein [Planctomycetales bacterium]|nr:VOC family protein [bacterium]UNM07684.1 MAG: VOC family protein [Planctomycetales bacterium]
MADNTVPAGFNTVMPYLILDGAAAEIEFLQKMFGASINELVDMGGGKVRHAELHIGNSMVMLADSREDIPARPTMMYVYVADVDETYAKAIAAGAHSEKEPSDEFYGDRTAGLRTDRGMQWYIATHTGKTWEPEY